MAQLKDLIVNGVSRFVSNINFNQNIIPVTDATQDIGSTTQKIGTVYATTFDGYLNGTASYSITATSLASSAGGPNQPIYFDASGKPVAVVFSGTFGTANRIVWTDSSNHLYAAKHYMSASQVALNSVTTNDRSVYINATAAGITFDVGSNTVDDGKFKIQSGATANIIISQRGIQAYTGSGTTPTSFYINPQGGDINIGPAVNTVNGNVTIGASVYNQTTSSNVIIGPHAANIQIGRTTETTAQDIQIGNIHFGSGIIAENSTHRLKSIISENNLYLFSGSNASIVMGSANTAAAKKILYINASDSIVRPGSDDSIKLGGPTTAWSNVYSHENFIVKSNTNTGIIVSATVNTNRQYLSIGYNTIQSYTKGNGTVININPDGGDIYLGKGIKITETSNVDETDLSPANNQSHNLGDSSNHWNTGYIDKIMAQSITCASSIYAVTGTFASSIYAANGIFTNSITAANKLVVDLTQVSTTGVALNGDTITIPVKAPVSGIWYGNCTNTASTTAKEVLLTDTYIDPSTVSIGQMLVVRFSTTNSAASPKMKVTNGNGKTLESKLLIRYGSTTMGTGVTSTGWSAGAVVPFIYSGTCWTRFFWENTNTNTTSPSIKVLTNTNNTKRYLVCDTGETNTNANTQLFKSYNSSSQAGNSSGIYFTSADMILMGAGWNDYAEFRRPKEENIEPGRVVKENGDGTLSLAMNRLERGCEIVTDTYGFGIGESDVATLPTAATGRVLAYPDLAPSSFEVGAPVCSGTGGTVSMMTEEEERNYPSRIIGTVSEIPDYEVWHGPNDVKVNGRIWIRIR